MKWRVYSVLDEGIASYARPFFCRSDREAERIFSDIVVDAEHPVGQHPGDYSLWHLGFFDDGTGDLLSEKRVFLVSALELRTRVLKELKDES